MVILTDFYDYLLANPNMSESTVQHYESAVRAVSKDMRNLGVISEPLENMTSSKFEIALFLILHNEYFIAKNTRGNNMYSNGLKQYRTYLKTVSVDDAQAIVNEIKKDSHLSVTERESIVKARVGQGVFRDRVLNKYKECIVSHIGDSRLLIASHIKPWSVSSNEERLSVDNGLLLNALYDKMFDLGLISFKPNGKMLISNTIKQSDMNILQFDFEGCFDLKSSELLQRNLEYHRDTVFLQ